MISIIIPANNEAAYIQACLEGVLSQETGQSLLTIIAANACTDDTVAIARAMTPQFAGRGWQLVVLDIKEAGKPNALNQADAVAEGAIRIYLDADVIMSASLVEGLATALNGTTPLYASGQLTLTQSESRITRAYGRLWSRLPFMTEDVPGAGLFAVNDAGRRRWQEFPKIISDDTYVRLQFAPHERILVPAPYSWPLVEGFRNLVRVRRRQDRGVEEVAALYPELMQNEGKTRPNYGQLLRAAPLDFLVYATVIACARIRVGSSAVWQRGR